MLGVSAIQAYQAEGLEGLGYMAGGIMGGIAGYQTGTALSNALSRQAMPNLANQRGSVRISDTQKAVNSLETDQKLLPYKADPNLAPGHIRRFVSKEEYWKIYDSGEVMSNNPEGTHWTPNNIISPQEAHSALKLQGDLRFGAVDVPYQNFDYAAKQTIVQTVKGSYPTEVITEYGVRISARGGRLIRFDTSEQKTFLYGDH